MGWIDESEAIAMPGSDVRYSPSWLSAADADTLFDALRAQIAWETHRIRLFGREIDSPRLSCWIGDAGAVYTYSRSRFEPRSWPPVLLPVRRRLAATLGYDFNSVLANQYRDGRDRMGWHSDDEPELGPTPVIASLSLGGARRFMFKPKRTSARGEGTEATSWRQHLELSHGSLLVMAGETQTHYVHALPATAKPVTMRINLTFRRID